MKIRELVEGNVVPFPRRHRNDPLNMMHRTMFGQELPAEPGAPTYRNGVSVARTPQGWAVFVNGQILDPGAHVFDDPERRMRKRSTLNPPLKPSRNKDPISRVGNCAHL
jgi:hypothetical protein